MVALTPFYKLFKPDGIKLVRTTWSKISGGGKSQEFMPKNGHKFRISLQFKPLEEED